MHSFLPFFLDDILKLSFFLFLGFPVKFVEVLDHGDKEDIAKSDKVDSSKILKQVAAGIDIDIEEQDEPKNIPDDFERKDNNLDNGEEPPSAGIPEQYGQHEDMVDEGKQSGEPLYLEPGSKGDLDVVGLSVAALRTVIICQKQAYDPSERYVPVESVLQVYQVLLPVRLSYIVQLLRYGRVTVRRVVIVFIRRALVILLIVSLYLCLVVLVVLFLL